MKRLLALAVALCLIPTAAEARVPDPVAQHMVQASTLSTAQFKSIARSVGWPSHTLNRLACVAFRESRMNPRAVGDHGNSIGLLQINVPANYKTMRKMGITKSALKNPRTNLKIGLRLYRARGWKPWSATVGRC